MSTSAERELSPYARVVADIRARISTGELEPGDRVPSTREITRQWGVAMATATKALSALREEGLVEAVRGVGTVVRGASGSEPRRQRARDPEPRDSRAQDSEPRDPQPRDPARDPVLGRTRPRAAPDGGHRRVTETALTREAVVRAALVVADAEGLGGLSMRRVSTELRVSTMALYRHVENKDELLRAMVDAVYTEVEVPDSVPPGWREAVELLQQREWVLYRAHPWLATLVTVTRPVMSERLMEYGEWIMSLLVERGCSPDDAMRIITVLTAYMSGMALQFAQVREMERETGVDSVEFWTGEGAELARGGAYPNMLRVSAPPEWDIDGTFAFGMAHLLDGLAPLVDSEPSRGGQEE